MNKVAIIGQMLNRNIAGKFSGGIQMVERLHAQVFLTQPDWEVYFIAPSDSEFTLSDPRFKTCLLETPSEEAYEGQGLTKYERGHVNKAKTKEMRKLINELKPDLIVNHSFSSSHIHLMAELSSTFPILNFVHNTPDTAMDIGYFVARLPHLRTLARNGGSVINVTAHCRDLWISFMRRRLAENSAVVNRGIRRAEKISLADVEQIYVDYCYPVFVSDHQLKPKVSPSFVVITRLDSYKRLHRLLDAMLCQTVEKFPLDIFVSVTDTNLQNNEYYVEKIEPLLRQLKRERDWKVNLHVNAPRQQILDTLANSTGNIVPCHIEAASITFLEAASFGVKSVVFGKTREGVLGHAAIELLGPENLVLINSSRKREELGENLNKAVKSISSDLESRKKLQQITLKKHSIEQRVADLMSLAHKVMNRYPRTIKSDLRETHESDSKVHSLDGGAPKLPNLDGRVEAPKASHAQGTAL